MLIHPWDEATREEWQAFLSRYDFGQLVTAGHVDGYPVVVPTHFLFDGDATVLLHLARPNPAWRAIEADPHVVLALTADYTYVEAAWNADPGTDPDVGVPTSYYTGVQLLCRAEVVDDPDQKAAILAAQLAHLEPVGSNRRTPSTADDGDRRQIRGIRALRLHVEAVRAKMKYGGNKTPEHRESIAGHLAERAGHLDAEARAHLLRRTATGAPKVGGVTLRDDTARALRRIALDQQRKDRVPGVFAGVVRGGGLAWHDGIGAARLEDPLVPPGPDDQFLVASNTKTFTATLVMQLRDEGRLSLDDTLDTHLPEVTQPNVTVRQCLAHASGMQREPVGEVWEWLVFPDRDQLVAGFNDAERVHPPNRFWHYSNLAYSVLGEVVARLDGRSWADALRARILDPLEMRRTTVGFSGAHADGYFVPPYTDVPVPQPANDLRALDPCGGLASTGADLARWSAFVADPVAEVLSPDTLEEMCEPQVLMDRERWTAAMGLGFFLVRSGTRTYVGHTGGMPGHITALFTDRDAKTGGVALTNSGTTTDIAGLALRLADHVTEHEPVEPDPWRPGTAVPAELKDLVGTWWSEGRAVTFSVREGRLEARAPLQPEHEPSSRFEQVCPDVFRTVAGREHGELLRVTRRDGRVTTMSWATYLLTREPLAFGEWQA